MARTLIGNIKGKDGRGITSIVKTGTTGSVDTYTITYTDRTTSMFTVNNSDNVSLQRQIVPSAAVESSTTASQTYAAGDYVVVNGVLRKAKMGIIKGYEIADSNSTATTVAGELAAALGKPVSPVYFSSRNSTSLAVTAPHDCVIEVEAWFERQWGYGGGEATLSISTPAGLSSMCAVAGHIYGGDTVGRSLHAFGAFSGAKGGKTYTFACSINGSGTGTNNSSIIARCFPA